MPELTLTDEQYERLEHVREDVEAAFVDSYRYIPIEDAIEYLLDTYIPPGERDAADDYEQLAAVNRILDEHDHKWRESGGDEPYEVDLPDGTVDPARARDDVRQLLFQHY